MKKTQVRFIRLRRYFWWLVAIWTLVLSGSLVWFLVDHDKEIQDLALNTARVNFEKDVLFRYWGADHGGVYVPVTAATQPNPYLAEIPERDVVTPSGRLLTLINPAYMTRQLYDLARQKKTGIQGHITSLRPINPINAPDAWETEALKTLEHGQAEIFSIVDWEGKSFLRLIKSFRTEKNCLKCHARHGYKEGDIRGGISISIPMATWTADNYQRLLIWFTYGFIWLLGLSFIGLGSRKIYRDLRDQIQIKEELQRSEEFTRSIIDNSPDCIKVLDLEGRLQFMSSAGQRLMQITNLPEYINFPYVEFFQGQDLQAAREALDQARQGETSIFRGYCPTAEGIPKWWEVIVAPIFDNNGQVERLLSVSRDITVQKHVEEELAKQREHLEAVVAERTAALQYTNEELRQARREWEEIFQAIGHPTMILDAEHRIIEANRATLAALGKDAAEIRGRKCYEFFHPGQDQQPADCPLEKLHASGQLETMEMEVEALEGIYLVSCTPMLDAQGRLEKVIHIVTDVTERRRAEQALRHSEQRFKDIAENALELIWEVDAQGKYVYASPVVEKVLGYTPEEVLNKHFYDLFHPDDREELKEQALAVFAAKQPFHEFPNRNLHKNGQEVWLATSGLPVLDARGELIGYRGADTDITARKKAEQALAEEAIRRRILVEQSRDGIVVLDQTGKVYEANQRYAEMLGYSAEEVRRLYVWDWDTQWTREELLEHAPNRR